MKGISDERVRLSKLRDVADTIIDTSGYNLSQFKNEMSKIFREDTERLNMSISIMSFGFKKGILDDFVFDAFLPNPFYIEELRTQTGNDKPVQDYVGVFQKVMIFMNRLQTWSIRFFHYVKKKAVPSLLLLLVVQEANIVRLPYQIGCITI